MTYDKIILGAGLYGLYAAQKCGAAGQRVLVLERDPAPFMRATYINQARVHMGYHYPRSYSTAIKSAHYFERFCRDYGFCLHTEFDQVYATSAHFSWTNAAEFRRFCAAAEIRCDDVPPEKYFNPGLCDGAFLTTEYTYDAQVLKRWFLEQLAALPNVEILYSRRPDRIEQTGSVWRVTAGEYTAEAPYLLNATYAGVNDIHAMLGLPPFGIKYEKCEIILCTVDEKLRNTGITVMDGPFFSLMPFGQTGLHSLTSVTFTPHETSYDSVAAFPCQKESPRQSVQLQRVPGQAGQRLALHEPACPQISEGRIRLCLPQQPFQYEAHPEGQRDRRLAPDRGARDERGPQAGQCAVRQDQYRI